MKVTVNIECTPQEARTFFGLPDVEPMQQEILDKIKDQILSSMGPPDLQSLMTQWVTMPSASMDMLQKALGGLTSGMMGGTSTTRK